MAKPGLYTPDLIRDYTEKGYWNQENLSDIFDRNAALYPGKVAFVDHKACLTWSEVNEWIDNTSIGLMELGLQKDSMVVVQLPNSIEIPLLRVVGERAGVLCLPVLRSLREREMQYILEHSGAEAVITTTEYRGFNHFQMMKELKKGLPHLKHIIVAGDVPEQPAVSLNDLSGGAYARNYSREHLAVRKYPSTEYSLVLLTSGTTGLPKFVEYPSCSRLYLGRAYAESINLSQDDIVGILGPAFIGPNTTAYYGAPQVPAKTVMLQHFDVESALDLIQKEKITVAGLVPTQLAMILNYPDPGKFDTGSLRVIICTGSPLPFSMALEAEKRLKTPIINFYGSVDAGGSTVHSLSDDVRIRHLTVGKPIKGVEFKLIDDSGQVTGGVGEICVRGPTMVSGYFKDPELNAASWSGDGWFKTGDYGKWDDGRLVIVGRKKDVIIRGGQNIFPAEIENLLLTNPAVKEAALVPFPDPVMGERACACIVFNTGMRLTFEEMTDFLKTKGIARYKLPEKVLVLDKLPKVADEQKVDKKALIKAIAGEG
ncbi:MAG: class I adenylate-forming enzyme family protein [Dehalococcoidia bacterium]|nr:class I adenylate-forming enzyme family protein [Dehalococcoidia bacterium]